MSSEAVKQFPLEEEYKKPTGITAQDISKLREWLPTQPHLPGEHITDLDLVLAYHSCGRSTELAKQLLDTHYTTRTLFTSFFKDRVVDDRIETACKRSLVKVLPTRTKEGYAVLFTQFLDRDPQNFVFADILKAQLMVLDLGQYEDGTWPGVVLVSNMAGLTLGHIPKIDLLSLRQYAYYTQEAHLLNIKGVHIFNAPGVFDVLLGMTKPLLRNSLLDLVHIHTELKTLEEFVPIEALPRDIGGSYKSLEECHR